MSQINTNVDGITLKLTNLEKVLWPTDNITKAELIQYYISVSEYMLPLVTDRPLSLIRYPDGIDGPKFYSKNAPDFTPEWINIYKKDDISYICPSKKADLVYLANLASLEIHAMNIQMQAPANPDTIIFDLDPSEGLSFETIKTTAIDLYNMLIDKGYHPHIKTSGSKGLHIYVPIFPMYSRIEVFDTAKKLGQEFINFNSQCTLKLSKEKRQGKILIDIYRNHDVNALAGDSLMFMAILRLHQSENEQHQSYQTQKIGQKKQTKPPATALTTSLKCLCKPHPALLEGAAKIKLIPGH